MKMFCAGFNLYGQFVKFDDLLLKKFVSCSYGDEIHDVELANTFSVAYKQNDVFLYGGKAGKTHQIQKIPFPDDLKIAQIVCNDEKVLILTENGLLFKLNVNLEENLTPQSLPNFLGEGRGDKITKIAMGSKITAALTQKGKLFNLPNKLEFENPKIIDIQVGREHCVLLDYDGNVYSFGRGSRGQLGHGTLEDEQEPKQIEALAGIKISKISTGGWHSSAISNEGDVYMWGWNGNGQLGLEGVSVMAAPNVVNFEGCLELNVKDVACGNRHTVALLENRKLYGCGWNKYRQLGDVSSNSENNVLKMTYLYDFSEFNEMCLKCGPWSTVVYSV